MSGLCGASLASGVRSRALARELRGSVLHGDIKRMKHKGAPVLCPENKLRRSYSQGRIVIKILSLKRFHFSVPRTDNPGEGAADSKTKGIT